MLEEYRTNLLEFKKSLGVEYFLHLSGQKEILALQPIYQQFESLFHPEAIEHFKNHYEQTPKHFESQRMGFQLLRAFAEKYYLESKVQDLRQQLAGFESKRSISVKGQSIPFHRATGTLSSQPDPQERRLLNQERLKIIGTGNEWREEHLRRRQVACQDLGYQNYWSWLRAKPVCDPSSYVSAFTQFSRETDEIYFRSLRELLPGTIGLSLNQADEADIDYFLQLAPFADAFPRDGVYAAYRETMAGLGIDTDRQRSVEIDMVERAWKHTSSFCIPISVPEDVRLSISLQGGAMDYPTLLCRGGQAQHYAWTSPTLAAEFRIAGDASVTLATGILFGHLTLEPSWLGELLRFFGPERFTKLRWLQELFLIRRSAAIVRYQSLLYSTNDLSVARRRYAEELTEATGFRHHREAYLSATETGTSAAEILRAWLLELQLREFLKTRFGHRWWSSAKAADFLKDIWNTGQRYVAEELSRLADLGPLTVDALVSEFHQNLA